MFYKRGQESQELDVAFQLLVDCSGSMYNKMEETKKSVVLFHEALKSLKSRTLLADFGKMPLALNLKISRTLSMKL